MTEKMNKIKEKKKKKREKKKRKGGKRNTQHNSIAVNCLLLLEGETNLED